MAHIISETLQLVEKFLVILKETGMLKSYYLDFCLSEKNDHVSISTFQHLIDNLKDVFFNVFDKWESLKNAQYKEEAHSQLPVNFVSTNVFEKKPLDNCMISNKDFDNVINSCSFSNHSRMNSGTEFEVEDSNELGHHLESHGPASGNMLENVPLSGALNQGCHQSDLHDSFNETNVDQNVSKNDSGTLENVNFPRVYTSLQSEHQSNIRSSSSALCDVLSLQKEYVEVHGSASQNASCMRSSENILDNVLSLSNSFVPAESLNKISTSVVDGGSIMSRVITFNNTQPDSQHVQTDNCSEHADYDDGPSENNTLETKELLEESLHFSRANQSTVDASALNNSSSKFPTYYSSEKSSISEKIQTQVYSSINCSAMNNVETKTDSRTYFEDVSGTMKVELKEFASEEHFKEQNIHGKKYFVCVHCNQSFPQMDNIKYHLAKTHKIHQDFSFSCELCGKKFFKKSSLQLHIESFHNGVKPFECHICLKRFSQKVVRDTHVVGHTGVYQYGCDECGKRFAAKNKLVFHLQTHRDPQYKCGLCNKLFTTKQYLQNHQRTHKSTTPKDIQICEYCSAVCPNQAALTKHERYKHRKVTFFCDSPGCSKKFVTRTLLERHQDRLHNVNKKMYQCKECVKSFSQEKSLQHHMKQNHTTGLSDEQLRPYHCTICDKRYAFANKLKLHVMTHTQEPPHCCTLCTKTFYRLDSFKLHMSSKHFYSDQLGFPKSHACDVCGHSFSTKSSLKMHQALHSQSNEDASSFDCAHCKKVFKSKNALEYHLKKHEGKFSYECSFCSKKFVRKCHLDDHIQSHMSERSFKCNFCPASFKRNKHLRDHLRRVHPNHITVDSLLESITNESNDQQNLLPAIKEELRISLAAL